jgi:hypothetical protein
MRQHYSAYSYFPGRNVFEHCATLAELGVGGAEGHIRVYWGDAFSGMVMGNLCLPSTLLVKRDIAARLRFNETMASGEDHDYHLRLARETPAALLDVASTRYRVGAADQLTRPEYKLMIAEHALQTILPVIERERARIRLPRRLLRRKLAAAHEWIAAERLARLDYRGARRHCLESLRQWPWRRRPWLLLLRSS